MFVELWLSTAQGPVRLLSSEQQEVLFVRQVDEQKVLEILANILAEVEYRPLPLSTFEQESVSALYFAKPGTSFRVMQRLSDAQICVFEADIRLADRFLMERFVYGSGEFVGLPQVQKGLHARAYQSLHQANLKPSNYKPQFRVLSLDIECSETGELYSIGLVAKDFQRVLMIGDPQAGYDWIEWQCDERALLTRFVEVVNEYNPDVFIGWAVVNFDFRLLIKRADLLGVGLLLGRAGEPAHWRDAIDEVDQGYVFIPGRVVIDGIDALKTATYQFESFSLENVAQSLLGKGKKTEDVDNRMAQINYDFRHNKIKLADYNREDCQLVLDIFARTQLLEFLTLRSQLTGLPLDRVGVPSPLLSMSICLNYIAQVMFRQTGHWMAVWPAPVAM